MNVDSERLAKGLYWQRAWKLIEGCTKVSPGCDNCWSESETVMRSNHPNGKIKDRALIVTAKADQDGAPVSQGCFTGQITMREDNLNLPLTIKKPTVFAIWNDLFHEDVTEKFIDEVYRVIQKAKQHTFLILTKRSDRMASYLSPNHNFQCPWGSNENVYHGVTVCNQQEADEKIPILLQVPGKRFLSIEPMLGPINLRHMDIEGKGTDLCQIDSLSGKSSDMGRPCGDIPSIHQVLLGGESGKNARPMHLGWVRTIRDQCEAAGVAFDFKQWGEWAVDHISATHMIGRSGTVALEQATLVTKDLMAHDNGVWIARVGKKKAGRTLDGKLHDDLIWKQETEEGKA